MHSSFTADSGIVSHRFNCSICLSRSDDRDIIVNKDRVVKVAGAVDKLIVIALVDVTA